MTPEQIAAHERAEGLFAAFWDDCRTASYSIMDNEEHPLIAAIKEAARHGFIAGYMAGGRDGAHKVADAIRDFEDKL